MYELIQAGSTIKSDLSWLKDQGKLSVTFADHLLLWTCS